MSALQHRAEVWREKFWPHQWIGQCRGCRRVIRCNSRSDAVAFFDGHASVAGLEEGNMKP